MKRAVLMFSLLLGVALPLVARLTVSPPSLPAAIRPLLIDRSYEHLRHDPGWRPPMPLELREPRFPAKGGRTINWHRAERQIRTVVAEANKGRFGIIVKNLRTGCTIKINPDARFASASIVKIPIVIALYKDIHEGRIDPAAGAFFREDDRSGGSGALKSEPSGVRVNLRDLSHLMLARSDNTATNLLADLVGYDRVTRLCRSLGWPRTDLVRPVMALELRGRGIENWTTPRETADQIERLYRRTLISRGASSEILRFMLNPPIADRLSRHLPRTIDVVHKTGLIFDNAHDVGILYLPGEQSVLVAAFVDGIGADYRAAKLPIARIARILYEEATPPDEHEPGRRRN